MLKVVSFKKFSDSLTRVGALLPSTGDVLDLTRYTPEVKGYIAPPPSFNEQGRMNMIDLVASGNDTAMWLRKVITNTPSDASYTSKLNEVKLLAPIPTPRRNIICVGKNYKDHVAEIANVLKAKDSAPSGDVQYPKYPQFFTKAPSAVIGTGDFVESHKGLTKWLDYEGELAVVIGKMGRDIPRDKARDFVWGVTVANDVTSRDLQKQHNQWFKGKTLDTTCPLGPCITHTGFGDVDPQNLRLQTWVNGELRQQSNTNNMIFDIAEIIHQLSLGFTLYPGDVVLTGTPQGVGYAMQPPKCLKNGDVVRIEIEHVGVLENPVRD
eukprot:gene24297-29376_t